MGTENVAMKSLELNKKLIYTSSVATIGLKNDEISDEKSESSLNDMLECQKRKYLAEDRKKLGK